MAAPFNISCSGDLECETCAGVLLYKWRKAYLAPQVRINLGITATLSAVTCPVTVALNGLFIYTVLSNPLLRNVPANLTVALLGITDFLVGLTAQPLFTGIVICRMSGHCESCVFEQIYYNVLYFFAFASIYHLTIISTDRLIAVKFPYRYQILVTSRKIVFSSIVVWLLCLLRIFIFLFTGLFDQNSADIVDMCFFILDVIAIFIIVASYVAMYLEARRHHKTIQKEIVQHQQNVPKTTLKATKTTFMVTCSVLGTYVINIVVMYCIFYEFPPNKSLFNAKVHYSTMCWTIFILVLSSLLNSFIYALSSEKLSKELKKKLGLKTTKVEPQQNYALQARCRNERPAVPALNISDL